MLSKPLRSGTNAAVATAFGGARRARCRRAIRVFVARLGGRRCRPAGVLSGPGTVPLARKEPRKLLGNNRLPRLVVALSLPSPGNGCLARRQARQTPLWTSAPAAPTVGQRSGSLQAPQRPQTGQLRPPHKRQPRGFAGDAPVRRTRPRTHPRPTSSSAPHGPAAGVDADPSRHS